MPFTQEEVILYRKGTQPASAKAIEYSKQYSVQELQKSCDSGPAKVTHRSKYWSETMPKIIHRDICAALELKKNA